MNEQTCCWLLQYFYFVFIGLCLTIPLSCFKKFLLLFFTKAVSYSSGSDFFPNQNLFFMIWFCILCFIHSSQFHILWLMEELGLTHYPQHEEGTKFLQLSDGKIQKYSDNPRLPFLSLLDMGKLGLKVSCSCGFLLSFTRGYARRVSPGPKKKRGGLCICPICTSSIQSLPFSSLTDSQKLMQCAEFIEKNPASLKFYSCQYKTSQLF